MRLFCYIAAMALNGFEKLINDLTDFDFGKELENIIETNKEAVTNLMATQMAEGRDITGNVRLDIYADSTVAYKNRKGVGLGSVTDRVTFYMTGELYQSLFTSVTGRMFEVKSPLETYEKMLRRVRREFYGLSEEKRREFGEEITLPSIRAILLAKTGLKV